MKKIVSFILVFCFFTFFSSGCERQSASIKLQSPTATPITKADPTNSDSKNQSQDFECVRAKPEPIINNAIFAETTFKLEKNIEFPHQEIGFEAVLFKNGDTLVVEHSGCENYTLVFRFETERFSNNTEDSAAWYKNAISLMEQTIKGIREPNLMIRGTKALKSHLKKTKTPKFDESIDFGGDEIRSSVSVKTVEKKSENKYEVQVSFGIGPL
jgi:hypothetical protein